MIDLLLELEPESRFIHIDRPMEESIRSLVDRSAKARGWLRATPKQCERLQRALDAKTSSLKRLPDDRVITVHYSDVTASAEATVSTLARFLGLAVADPQIAVAAALVRPRTTRPGTQGNTGCPPVNPNRLPNARPRDTVAPTHVGPVDR
jgi:hypothetical protein